MKAEVEEEKCFSYYLLLEVIVGKCKERFLLRGKGIIVDMAESEQCLLSFAILLSLVIT